MARTRGAEIRINLSAGTAQLILDFEKAKGVVKNFGREVSGGASGLRGLGDAGHDSVTGVQAVSGALRVLEGGITNNLRAAERFTANVLGLGPLLQKAFPVVGAIAFAGILVKMGEEAYAFYKTVSEAGRKMDQEFSNFGLGIRAGNDELKVANDRLDAQIAKLQGKRENTLQMMLDEARLAADRLAESLNKDLQNLTKLLEENKVGFVSGLFSGQALTGDLAEDMKKFGAQIQSLTNAGLENYDKMVTAEDRARANANLRLVLETAINDKIRERTAELEKAKAPIAHPTEPGAEYVEGPKQTAADSERIRQLEAIIGNLRSQKLSIDLQFKGEDKKQQVAGLEANKRIAELGLPYQNKIAELLAQVEEAKAKLLAVGKGIYEQIDATAEAAAIKALQQLNQERERKTPGIAPLTKASHEFNEFYGAEQIKAQTEAETVRQTNAKKTITDLQAQAAEYRSLAAAIGQGFEAQRAAEIEIATINKFGKERLADKSYMEDERNQAELDATRAAVADEIDTNRSKTITELNDKLKDQIAILREGAKAESLSGLAVKQAELAEQIKQVTDTYGESVEAQQRIDLLREKFDTEQDIANGKALRDINLQTSAYLLLEAAQMKSAKAARERVFESKVTAATASKEGLTPKQEAAMRAQETARLNVDIGESVAKRVNYYTDELAKLKDEESYLMKNAALYNDLESVNRTLRDLFDEQLKLQVQQELKIGGMRNGVRAFFLEMQEQSKKTGQIIYDTLNRAVEDFSTSLTKALTGQRAEWGKMFQGLGEDLLKQTIKAQTQTALGNIGKMFPKLSGLGGLTKNDGSSASTALWVRMAGAAGFGPITGQGVPATSTGTLNEWLRRQPIGLGGGGILGTGSTPPWWQSSGSGELKTAPAATNPDKPDGSTSNPLSVFVTNVAKAGGGILSTLGNLIGAGAQIFKSAPHRAGGGDVSAGSAYMVGEQGAEMFVPRASGTIVSNSALRGSRGASVMHVYTIDARGTDPLLVEQRVKSAIVAAHDDAVRTSVRAVADMGRRNPRPVRG